MRCIKFLLVFTICVLITGCGKEQLKCEKKENDETGVSNYIVTMNFENGKLLNANINNVFSVNDDYKEYLDVMIGKFKEALKLYEGKKGVTVTVNNSDTKITTLIKFNLNKMSEDDKKVIGFDSKDSRKNIKAFYEGEGFSCE